MAKRLVKTMNIQYKNFTITSGDTPSYIGGFHIPQALYEALCKTCGTLRKNVYIAFDADNPSLVAMLLGYHRPHTAQQKLAIIAGDEYLKPSLLNFAERSALHAGAAIIKYEADVKTCQTIKNRSLNVYSHYRQSTDFTCGPVAVLNAMHRRGLVPSPTREEELAVWRESTLAVACDPYGLALAAMRRGAKPTIRVSSEGPVLNPESGMGILDPALASDTQIRFAYDAKHAGIGITVSAFDAAQVGELIDNGAIVVLLIDQLLMHGVSCPHWVTVTGHDRASETLIIDDPWTDINSGETSVDAYQMPITLDALNLMIHYDAPRSAQALIIF